jgi:hypothetical protein
MQERRRTPRFPVQRPALLIVQGDPAQRVSVVTVNVSALGALVLIDSQIAEGTGIELVLNLKRGKVPTHSCPGRVVRTETLGTLNRVAVAIECDHVFTEHSRE